MRVRDKEGEEEANGAPGKLYLVLSVICPRIVKCGRW
jgi:hypothetical protein